MPSPLPFRSRRLLAVGLLSILPALACGGSGGGGSSPTEPGRPSAAQVEASSFALLNQARQQAGMPALVLDAELSVIARRHSEAMRDGNFFAHIDPANGKSFPDRLRDGGQSFLAAGENLATVSNASDPAGFAHDRLMASIEHRNAILSPRFNRVGVGASVSGSSYWITQLFVER